MQLLYCRGRRTSYRADQVSERERGGTNVSVCPICGTTLLWIDPTAPHAAVKEILRLRAETAASSAAARVEDTARLEARTAERVKALRAENGMREGQVAIDGVSIGLYR